MGVAAPLTSCPTQEANKAVYLGGSARAAVVLSASPVQDAVIYTPAAKLTVAENDVEDGHYTPTTEAEAGEASVSALSAQSHWAAGRLNPFGNLWDLLAPVRDWFAGLMPVATLESALVLAGAQASDLSVPIALQMVLMDPPVGKPAESALKPSQKRGQGAGPAKVKVQKPLPAWLRYYRPSPTR